MCKLHACGATDCHNPCVQVQRVHVPVADFKMLPHSLRVSHTLLHASVSAHRATPYDLGFRLQASGFRLQASGWHLFAILNLDRFRPDDAGKVLLNQVKVGYHAINGHNV